MQDSRDKKKIGRNVYYRASRKKGFKGNILFNADYLTKKELKALNGEVRVYNMYDQIMSFTDFKLLSKEERNKALINLIKIHGREKLTDFWGLKNRNVLSNMCYNYGIGSETKNINTREMDEQYKAFKKANGIITPEQPKRVYSRKPSKAAAPAKIEEAPKLEVLDNPLYNLLNRNNSYLNKSTNRYEFINEKIKGKNLIEKILKITQIIEDEEYYSSAFIFQELEGGTPDNG